MVRVPGFEPGFPRWQRGVITTTLRSQRLDEMGGLLLSIGQLGSGMSNKCLIRSIMASRVFLNTSIL